MTDPVPVRPINPVLKAALEFGPILAFLAVYLVYRNDTFRIGGTEYSGFVAVTAAFMPVFLLALGTLWLLTRRIARVQLVTAAMLILFGGLGVWLNDPSLVKMKPTAVYGLLTLVLGIGLLQGRSWLKYVMEDVIPLKDKGWMILTKRVTLLFALSALANEIVWRSFSTDVWVFFETLVMPVVILVFFLAQIGLYVDYVTLKPQTAKEKPGSRKRKQDRKRRARRPEKG